MRPTEIQVIETPTSDAPPPSTPPKAGIPQTTAELEQPISNRLVIAMANTWSANARTPIVEIEEL